jgi:hypothetical protein
MFRVNPAWAWAWAWACDAMRYDPTTAPGIHPQGVARLASGCSAGPCVCVERVRAGTGGPLMAVANGRGGARGTCRGGQALMFQNGETREDMALQRPWPRRSVAPAWRGSAQRFTSCPSRPGSGARGWPAQQFTRTWLSRRLAGRRGSGLRGLSALHPSLPTDRSTACLIIISGCRTCRFPCSLPYSRVATSPFVA